MAATVVKTLAKLTIGVGAVYVTVDQGVWDGIGQGDSALNKVKQSVLPATSEYLQKVPSVSDLRRTVLSKWNSDTWLVLEWGRKRGGGTFTYIGSLLPTNSIDTDLPTHTVMADVGLCSMQLDPACVETTFTYMAHTPEATGKYCKEATNYVKKSLKS